MTEYILPSGDILWLKGILPGWGALLEKINQKVLTSKDVKEVLGISYRQLNDWEVRGGLKSVFDRAMKQKTEGWRKFSVFDLLCLGVLKESKKHGIAITSLKQFMGDIFLTGGYICDALPYLVYERDVFLCTDLDKWMDIIFLEPEDQYFKVSIDDIKRSEITVILPLNKIVENVFEKLKLKDFQAIKKPEGGYTFIINGVPLALENLTDL